MTLYRQTQLQSGAVSPGQLYIIQTPSNPLEILNTFASGDMLVTYTVVGSNGTGTWSKVSGWSKARLRSPATGSTAILETNAAGVSGDNGSKSVTCQYTETGLAGPISVTTQITVSSTIDVVTGLTQSPANPITLVHTFVSGVSIATLTVVGGSGNGTWSKVSGWSKASLRTTSGRSVVLETNAAGVIGDVGPRSVTCQYIESGMSSAISITTDIAVQENSSSVTGLTQNPDNPVVLYNDFSTGAAIATLSAVGGVGDGVWTKGSGWSKASLRTTSGRSVVLETNAAGVSGDNGSKSVVCNYFEPSMTAAIPITVSITVQTRTTGIPSTFWLGYNSQYDDDRAMARIASVENWMGANTRFKVVQIFTGSTDHLSWNSVLKTGSQYLVYGKALVDKGMVPVFAIPVCTLGDKQELGGGNRYANVNSGASTSEIQACANRIKNALGTSATFYIRPGWEQTLDSFPWSIRPQSIAPQWRTALAKVCEIFKNVMPNNCKTDLCYQKDYKNHGLSPTDVYVNPSDEGVIDIITIDHYDRWGSDTSKADNFNDFKKKFVPLIDLAVQKGLDFGIDESGLGAPAQEGGGDNKFLMENYYELITTYNVKWWCLFRADKKFGASYDSHAIHSIVYFNGSTLVAKSPFNGPTQRADPSAPANGGAIVGSENGTGYAAARYKQLFAGVRGGF